MAETDLQDRSTSAPATAATRGVHHLALTTEDMKATTEFYVDVVGSLASALRASLSSRGSRSDR